MRQTCLLMFLLVLAAGCYKPGRNAEPVEISGQVSLGAKPLHGVMINFQPVVKGGAEAAFPVDRGSFRGPVIPGKYTYFVSAGSAKEALDGVPEKFLRGALDRTVDIEPGKQLDIRLN